MYLLPEPKSVTCREGVFLLPADGLIFYAQGYEKNPAAVQPAPRTADEEKNCSCPAAQERKRNPKERRSVSYTQAEQTGFSHPNEIAEALYEYAGLLQQSIREETGFCYERYPLENPGRAEARNRYPDACREKQTLPGTVPERPYFAGFPQWRRGTVKLQLDMELRPQQYRLSIDGTGVYIFGGDASGVLYGIQTLRQILRQRGAALPLAEIKDEPDIPVRGFYHDVTRGRVPKLSWLKRLADTLCHYKINQLQLYVEHSYLFAGMTELWRGDTPLTAEDIQEFDRYCAARGIELVPSLASFGHLYHLLSTRQYRKHCELPDAGETPFGLIARMEHHTLDVLDPEGVKLVRALLGEYMALFSSRKFNICADETFDLGKGKNRERAKKDGGVSGLYMDYVCGLCAFIKEQGRTPMLWGDVMLGFPELSARLPEGTICLNWGYSPEQSEDSTRLYARQGVRQYVCPGVQGWNHLVSRQRDAYENISRMSSYAVRYGCEGFLNTDWGDFGHVNDPEFSVPGLICGAAAAWNREALPDYDELNRRISVLEYRDRTETFAGLTGMLSEQESFGWLNVVWFKERWSAAKDGGKAELQKRRQELDTAPEKAERIRACTEGLCRCMGGMDRENREIIYPYLLAAEGMLLWNRVGAFLLSAADGKEPDGAERLALAAQLEAWFFRYRRRWQKLSRESELSRIGEVVFWYADRLREPNRAKEPV